MDIFLIALSERRFPRELRERENFLLSLQVVTEFTNFTRPRTFVVSQYRNVRGISITSNANKETILR